MSVSALSVASASTENWEMTLVLLLFLALTASWTGLVQCEEEEEKIDPEAVSEDFIFEERTPTAGGKEEDPGSGDETTQENLSSSSRNSEEEVPPEDKDTEPDDPTLMIVIPLVIGLIIIPVTVCGVLIYCRRTKPADTKEDHYLDNEDHEKVPMPMFDDDIQSVMELEMEDLENWMTKERGVTVDTGQI